MSESQKTTPDETPVVENVDQVSQAEQTILQARKNRENECLAEINAVLQKYRCNVVTDQRWRNGLPVGPATPQVEAY